MTANTIHNGNKPTSQASLITLGQRLCNMGCWLDWCEPSCMSYKSMIKTSLNFEFKIQSLENKQINKLIHIWFQRYFEGLYESIPSSFTKKNGLHRWFFDIEINNIIFHKIRLIFYVFTVITRNKFNVMPFTCWQSRATVS